MMPLLILTVTLLLVRFPVAAMLQGRFGADAIWWSFPVSSALAAVLAVIYYKYGGWRTARMLEGIEAPASGAQVSTEPVAPTAESATGT
jgi:Na+-driven multidrug efflux pump